MTATYLSISEFPGDGVTTEWEFNFAGGYISREHVLAYIRSPLGAVTPVPTAGAFVSDFKLSVVPAVPAGHTLRIYRETPRSEPLVNFTGGSNFTESNLDLLARQTILSVAEAFDIGEYTAINDLISKTGESAAAALAAKDAAEAAADRVDLGALDAAVETAAIAATKAGEASAAKTLAEAARDAAEDAVQYDYLVANGTSLTALTGMTSGQKAYVRSTEHVWNYNGSAWVDLGPSATSAKLNAARFEAFSDALDSGGLRFYTGNGPVYPIATNPSGYTVLGFNISTGKIVGSGLLTSAEVTQEIGNTLEGYGSLEYIGSGPIIPIEVDQNRRVVLGYNTATNQIVGAGLRVGGDSPVGEGDLPLSLQPVVAAINHSIGYGQSLSVGAEGLPVISTSQPYSNITFNGGPRAAAGDYSAFKPLVEDSLTAPDGNTNRGETACSGAANYASTLAAKENGLIPSSHVILASAAGHGAYTIAKLEKGSAWYASHFQGHVAAAKALNTNYACHVVNWAQGENDAETATLAYYHARLIQLQADAEADVKAVSGQTSPVFFVTYQMSYKAGAYKNVPLAQLKACQESDRFFLATPTYHLPHAVDAVHLTAVGYKWLGAYYGRAYKQLVIDKKKPKWLNPVSAVRRGTLVVVSFDVPTAPMVLDTTTLAVTTDHGFQVRNGAGAAVTISSIAVAASGTELHITLASEPVGASVVRCALDYRGAGLIVNTGASSNLRDSNTDTITISGVSRPLYHVAPHFELPIVVLGE